MNKHIFILFLILINTLGPGVMGTYTSESIDITIYSESGTIPINLNEDTQFNFTPGKGKLITASVRPSKVNLTTNNYNISIPVIFRKSEIMNGIQTSFIALPSVNYSESTILIRIYRMSIFSLNSSKGVLWYKQNATVIQDTNRDYIECDLIALLPDIQYLIVLNYYSHNEFYITENSFNQDSQIKSKWNNTEINITADIAFKVSKFLSANGGDLPTTPTPTAPYAFHQWYMNYSLPVDPGNLYAYSDIINPVNNTQEIHYYTIDAGICTNITYMKNYNITCFALSPGHDINWWVLYYESPDKYYIPLVLYDRICNYTYLGKEIYTMLKPTATLLYTDVTPSSYINVVDLNTAYEYNNKSVDDNKQLSLLSLQMSISGIFQQIIRTNKDNIGTAIMNVFKTFGIDESIISSYVFLKNGITDFKNKISGGIEEIKEVLYVVQFAFSFIQKNIETQLSQLMPIISDVISLIVISIIPIFILHMRSIINMILNKNYYQAYRSLGGKL